MTGQEKRESVIARMLDAGPWSGFQKKILLFSALALLVDGIANQLVSLSVPALMKEWMLPREAFAGASGIRLIASILGNVVGGMIGDKLGRRTTVIWSIAFVAVLDLAGAFVNGVFPLTLVRLLSGLGSGVSLPCIISLLVEFTPERRRARAISMALLCSPAGVALSGVFAALILPHFGWRMLFVASGIIPLTLTVLFYFFLPELPRYLARFPKRLDDVVKLMNRMGYRIEDKNSLREVVPAGRWASIDLLFKSNVRRDTFYLWGMTFFINLAAFTVIFWIPSVLAEHGFSARMTSASLTAWASGGICGSLAVGFVIERLGSRNTMFWFIAAAFTGAMIFAVSPLDARHAHYVLVMLFVENIFVVGIMSTSHVLAAHLYPSAAKATGLGVTSAIGRFGGGAASVVGVIALYIGGTAGYFSFVGMALVVTCVFVFMIAHHVARSEREKSISFAT